MSMTVTTSSILFDNIPVLITHKVEGCLKKKKDIIIKIKFNKKDDDVNMIVYQNGLKYKIVKIKR